MRLHHATLQAKGWSDSEIERAEQALRRAQERKHPALAMLELLVYWGLLFLTVVGIFTVSTVIVPVLLVLDTAAVALVLLVLGLSLGALFAIIIRDIDWLGSSDHAFTALVLIVVGLANIYFIVAKTNGLAFAQRHAPLALGVVFAAALIAPYVFHLTRERMRQRHGW